jgi:hypothetical protein
MPPLHFALACAGGYWLLWGLARTRRTYFRVVPGRLDVLTTRFLRASMTCARSLALADALIVCRYDKMKLTIASAGGENGKPYKVDLRRLAAPHAFAKSVFQAALSPRPAPALPGDALLG